MPAPSVLLEEEDDNTDDCCCWLIFSGNRTTSLLLEPLVVITPSLVYLRKSVVVAKAVDASTIAPSVTYAERMT